MHDEACSQFKAYYLNHEHKCLSAVANSKRPIASLYTTLSAK